MEELPNDHKNVTSDEMVVVDIKHMIIEETFVKHTLRDKMQQVYKSFRDVTLLSTLDMIRDLSPELSTKYDTISRKSEIKNFIDDMIKFYKQNYHNETFIALRKVQEEFQDSQMSVLAIEKPIDNDSNCRTFEYKRPEFYRNKNERFEYLCGFDIQPFQFEDNRPKRIRLSFQCKT